MSETKEPTQGVALSQVGPKQTKAVPGANNGKYNGKMPPPVAETPLYRVKRRVFIYGRIYNPGDVIAYAGKVGPSACLEPVVAKPEKPAEKAADKSAEQAGKAAAK